MAQSESNPSLQCTVCGQWKRLHGKDENGIAIQRFYGSCEQGGVNYDHEGEVCDECCKNNCPNKQKHHELPLLQQGDQRNDRPAGGTETAKTSTTLQEKSGPTSSSQRRRHDYK
jgi:hypothetical protein